MFNSVIEAVQTAQKTFVNTVVQNDLPKCYNTDMTNKQTDNILQWTGAVAIVLGHGFNAMGPSMYPWNILVFAIGTLLFLTWAVRARNQPQMMVNVVSLTIGLVGLYKALG
jgi:hypothetical protein